jgi:CTP:molybdopterin cytidylyltransferase MocA
MGSPKALAEFRGRPLIEHLLSPAWLRELGDVVVVLGHDAEIVRPMVKRLGYRHVVNPDPDQGRTGSVQIGLKALAESVRAVFVQPVDCPIVLPETYASLAAAIGPADVAVPSYRGKHGHPPLLSARIFPQILAAGPDVPLRNILHSPGVVRRCVEVNDPGVFLNIDRPEDLQ